MKKFPAILASLSLILLAACGGNSTGSNTPASVSTEPIASISIKEDPVVVSVSEKEPEQEKEPEEVIPEGMYRSELTNEWISEEMMDQRPVAIMVDNDKVANPHYGTSKADIVYELVNSYYNNRVTRFMCIVKDWKNIEVFGNVRSTRPTNCILFPEYNAILLHDGGPYFIDEWLAYPNATNHLSGGFARIDRGKASFYEEFITSDDYKGVGDYAGKTYSGLIARINKAGFDEEYNKYYMGRHFSFSDKTYSLDGEKKVIDATHAAMPFGHNESELKYNKETGLYDFYEFGELYKDVQYDETLSFANAIIYTCSVFEYNKGTDAYEGYMLYNCIGEGDGYFLTGGKAIPIKWKKPGQGDLTYFTNAVTGEDIVLNTGKTYITIVPSDSWDRLVIE